MSDVINTKPSDFIAAFFRWYFSLFSISGLFSVTYSVVLAYVADATEKVDRSTAYGLVSATFAASLVTSPALGAWISESWGDDRVVLLVIHCLMTSIDCMLLYLVTFIFS